MSKKPKSTFVSKAGNFLDLDYLLTILRKYWLFIAISFAIGIIVAFFINKTTPPKYEVGASLLISSEENSFQQASEQFMEGFGMFSGQKNFQNELQVLRSSQVIEDALDNLNFQVSYYEHSRFVKTEMYKTSPFVVSFDPNHPQPINTRITIKIIDESNFEIKAKADRTFLYSFQSDEITQELTDFSMDITGKFNEYITTDYCDFVLKLNTEYDYEDYKSKKYSFVIHNPKDLIKEYQNKLEISRMDIESTVAEIRMETPVPQKGIDFLNSLLEAYLNKDLEKKNHMSTKTVEYIEGQLDIIEDSLQIAGEDLEEYRTRHQVIDISQKSDMVYEQMQELEREKATLQVNLRYYNYINDYFEQNTEFTDLIAPSAMGIEDQLLNNMIQELIQLNAQKVSLIENNQEKNPYLKRINIQIDNLRNTIGENIKYALNTTNIGIQDIDARIAQVKSELQKLPQTERELFGIERKFNLTDAIYTYLLEKRAEAQIAKASYLPDAEIVEYASMIGTGPIAPKKRRNYLIFGFLGLLLPILFFRIRDITNTKIVSKVDITKRTSLPIVGEIFRNNKRVDLVVKIFPKSGISESFRMLRTSLKYFIRSKDHSVISVTSTKGQEGKSFVSANLAISLANTNAKTVILGYDLRKPRLFEKFGANDKLGVSSYLSEEVSIEDIIQPTKIEGLDIIPAGPVPPNPSELISSARTNELIQHLKKEYNYVIIDTPPVGIISDSLALMDNSDLTIYLVRQNHTHKKEFETSLRSLEDRNIENICLLMNDVPLNIRSKYGYGYYEHEKKRKKK